MNEPIATNREAAFTPHLPSRLPFDWSLWAAPTIPPSYPPRAVCSPPPERYGLSFCTTSTSDHVHPCRHLILCMGLKLLVFTALRGLRGGPCRAVMAVNSLGGGVWRYLQHCCHWSGQSLACEYIYVCIACTLWRGSLSWNKAACPFTSDRCYPSVVIASWRLSRISFSRTLAMATFTRVEPALMEIA